MVPFAHAHEFGHFLGASFEANLAYSVIIKLGDFAGASIVAWTEREMLRVIPALCETKEFNERAFASELENVRDKYRGFIGRLNMVCLGWAVFAITLDVVLLGAAPFFPDTVISIWTAIMVGSVLFGAVPTGVVGVIVLIRRAQKAMREDSKAFDKMIMMLARAPAEKVEQARTALLHRLAEQRAADRVGH